MMMCPHSEQDVTWYNLTLLCPGRACIACWLGEKFPKLVLAGLGWAGWAGLGWLLGTLIILDPAWTAGLWLVAS